MNDDVLQAMLADAKNCNARLRKITGNLHSSEKLAQIKAAGALGGYRSHKNGRKKGKNGTQQWKNLEA